MSERTPMDDLQREYAAAREALPACPTAEEIRRFRENRLGEERAFQVEFHLNDCAQCIELVERLEAPAADTMLSEEEESRLETEIAGRLGLDRPPRHSFLQGALSWLWTIRTPLYVPAAAAMLLLALLLVGRPGAEQPAAPDAGILPVKSILVDQAVLRSGGHAITQTAITAGDAVLVEIFLDGLDHGPGSPVSCTMLDSKDRELFSSMTEVEEEYSVRAVLRFPEAGDFRVLFTTGTDGPVIANIPVHVLSAARDMPGSLPQNKLFKNN